MNFNIKLGSRACEGNQALENYTSGVDFSDFLRRLTAWFLDHFLNFPSS